MAADRNEVRVLVLRKPKDFCGRIPHDQFTAARRRPLANREPPPRATVAARSSKRRQAGSATDALLAGRCEKAHGDW